jgi:hypothetical protein
MADDFFEGTWRARQSEPSQWKVDQPAPQQAYLRFEPTDTGYLMVAYGVVNGEACVRSARRRSSRTDVAAPCST